MINYRNWNHLAHFHLAAVQELLWFVAAYCYMCLMSLYIWATFKLAVQMVVYCCTCDFVPRTALLWYSICGWESIQPETCAYTTSTRSWLGNFLKGNEMYTGLVRSLMVLMWHSILVHAHCLTLCLMRLQAKSTLDQNVQTLHCQVYVWCENRNVSISWLFFLERCILICEFNQVLPAQSQIVYSLILWLKKLWH